MDKSTAWARWFARLQRKFYRYNIRMDSLSASCRTARDAFDKLAKILNSKA